MNKTGKVETGKPRASAAREKQFHEAIDVIVNFVRAVSVLRALRDAKVPRQSFWLVMNNSTFDMAAIDFCKLFGTDQKARHVAHWKNVVRGPHGFEAALQLAARISKEEWDVYKKEVKKYRDTTAAHLSSERREIKKFPRYDLALKAAQFYYERAVDAYTEETGKSYDRRDLNGYVREFREQADRFARLAVDATTDQAEMVDFPGID
jgi:hypothetical protein